MTDPILLSAVAAIFLLAGTVKGVIGLGLPSTSIALLVIFFDLPGAMAIMIIPAFVTNVWQGVAGGNFKFLVRRLWPFFLLATLAIGLGGSALVILPQDWLLRLLAFLLIAYSLSGLLGFSIRADGKSEPWLGAVCGFLNGLFAGMTGSYGVPGILYMQATGLTRDQLVQGMGILFTLSTLGLIAVLGHHGFMTAALGIVSGAALIPAFIGMVLGQKIRSRIPEETFKKLFFWALIALGCLIVGRTL